MSRLPRTMSRRIYESLRERIVRNEFMPGQAIGENELAAHYNVSRTPVREALRRLEQDRLVTRGQSGRGYFVRHFDLEEMDEIYDVRVQLEDLALRTLATRLTSEVIHILEDVSASFPDCASANEALIADERFHLSLATCSGNRPLLEFLEKINHRIHVIRSIDFVDSARRTISKAEHAAIIAALLNHELEDASRLLCCHILRSKASCQRLAQERLAAIYRPRAN